MDTRAVQPDVTIVRSGRTIWWMVPLLCVLGAAGWHYRTQVVSLSVQVAQRFTPQKPAKPPQRIPVVGTAQVGTRDVPLYLSGLGTVTANKTVTVRSRVDGQLMEVPIAEGQAVQEGDVLALIDPRLWQAQLEQAEGQLARDQAPLTGAKQTLARYQMLHESNTIGSQQVDEQNALVQQSEAAVRTDLAAIANAKLQLEYCRITAPISGRIGLRLVDAGNMVRTNDPTGIAVITQLKPIAVLFTIPQDDIAQVMQRSREGEPPVVELFDREFKDRLATGTLTAVDNQVDSTTGTLRLKAVFDNSDESLFPNQFVNARMLVNTLQDAVVIPSAALQRGPDFSFVYVLQQDSTVAIREVVAGVTNGGETVIQSGLQPGETVVTDGLDKLQPGSRVTIKTGDGKGAPDGRGNSPGGSGEPLPKTDPIPGRPTAIPKSETDTRLSPPEGDQKVSDTVSTVSGSHIAGLEQHPDLPAASTAAASSEPSAGSADSGSSPSNTLNVQTAVKAESSR